MGLKRLITSCDSLRYSLADCESNWRPPGRSRNGALRTGEMERDCFISQGSSAVLYDRLYLASDTYEMIICNKCHNPMNSVNYCINCNTDDMSKIQLPFSCKLLLQELQAMGIKVNYKPEDF